jgi:hypothetical protein
MISKGDPCKKCGNTKFEFWLEQQEGSNKTDGFLQCIKCGATTKFENITIEKMELGADDNNVVLEEASSFMLGEVLNAPKKEETGGQEDLA